MPTGGRDSGVGSTETSELGGSETRVASPGVSVGPAPDGQRAAPLQGGPRGRPEGPPGVPGKLGASHGNSGQAGENHGQPDGHGDEVHGRTASHTATPGTRTGQDKKDKEPKDKKPKDTKPKDTKPQRTGPKVGADRGVGER